MDELKISWDKKISMREIAQFYEDKLRELQSKNDILNSSLIAQLEKMTNFEERIKDVESKVKNAEFGLYLEAQNVLKNVVGPEIDRLILNQNRTQQIYEASSTAKWHVSLELFMYLFDDDEIRKRAIAWLKLLRDKVGKASQLKVPEEIKRSDYTRAFNNAIEMAMVYLTEADRTAARITKIVEEEIEKIRQGKVSYEWLDKMSEKYKDERDVR
jgi:hypothetical protein